MDTQGYAKQRLLSGTARIVFGTFFGIVLLAVVLISIGHLANALEMQLSQYQNSVTLNFLFFGLISLIATALLLGPFVRKPRQTAPRSPKLDILVFRLAEGFAEGLFAERRKRDNLKSIKARTS